MKTIFAEEISRLMRERGLSARALGKQLGLSNSTITGWLKGALPHAAQVKKIADSLGVPTERLLGHLAPVRQAREMTSIPVRFCQAVEIKGRVLGLDLFCRARLPFLPRTGDMIAPLKGDDYRLVNEIYWSPDDGFTVYFENTTCLATLVQAYKKIGWKQEEG